MKYTLSVICKSCGALILSALFFLQPVGADVYRFTDEHGVIHYTNVRPSDRKNVKTFTFPCYASDLSCKQLDWERVPLNRQAFGVEIEAAAREYAVEESLIRAVIHAESAYQPDALSPRGAQGLMQLLPITQKELEIADVFDPASNIKGGTLYLSRLLSELDQNIELAAAAYNAGLGAVRQHDGVPPYRETLEYVRRIKILHRRYRTPES